MISLKEDVQLVVRPRDLLKKLSLQDQRVELDIQVPDSFYQSLLEQLLERDYLNETGDKQFCLEPSYTKRQIHWLQVTRLPIHPNENESYDLLSRWQGVLSSLHAWGYRLVFLLLRSGGETKLFLGTVSTRQEVAAEEALEQIREAAFGSMPGMGLRTLDAKTAVDEVRLPLLEMEHIGAVTGIPSFRTHEQRGMLQTLDPLAFGIRDGYGNEKNYAMLVLADPISDREISDIIARYRQLGSQIHTAVRLTAGESLGRGESGQGEAALSAGIGMLGSVLGSIGGSILGGPTGGLIGARMGKYLSGLFGVGKQVSVSGSASTNVEYLDKFAQYAEQVTEHHIDRLNQGRNLGFWNTGVYVLGMAPKDVVTVTGMLRSIYSGDQTYFEPIRLHRFRKDSHAMEIVRNRLELLPMREMGIPAAKNDTPRTEEEWHALGKVYQYLSTPINTQELSLATSLPRRDVPGLRFVKTAVRFANNPAPVQGEKITLGHIVDTGIVQNTTYDIDVNALVRHALVTGSTGSGKSTTCKRIVTEVLQRNIPTLVIEPAKDDYVRWAMEQNRNLPEEKRFLIFMPGVREMDGVPMEPLYINPFQPAAAKGVDVDLLQHSEQFALLLNACLPAEDIVPVLLEEVVHETIRTWANEAGRSLEEETAPLDSYPDVGDMVFAAKKVMGRKTYADKNRDNLQEVLMTRLRYLQRGMRGKILNINRSVDYERLFSRNVVINLSRLAGSKNKSLVMSLLMQALYEYRQSCYAHDGAYRTRAQSNRLCHLTLIEEAHNVLLKPQGYQTSGSPQRAAAELFGTMLSEVRGYGEGFVVVDQVPTRLIEDVTKNTNYKIVHRLTAPDDQEVMAACMAFRDDQKYIIPALEKGNAIICGDEDDAAAWVKIPAPGHR